MSSLITDSLLPITFMSSTKGRSLDAFVKYCAVGVNARDSYDFFQRLN